MSKRIFITGYEGKIGLAVLDRLKERGHKCFGFDKVHGQDILDRNRLSEAMGASNPSTVIHCAGIPHPNYQRGDVRRFYETNVTGTLNVLEAAVAAQVKRFIYLSSTAYYGIHSRCDVNHALPVSEVTPPVTCHLWNLREGALDAYCQSKVMAEQLCAYYGSQGLLDVVILRSAPCQEPEERFPEGFDWRKANHGCFWAINPRENLARAMSLVVERGERFGSEVFNLANRWTDPRVDLDAWARERLGANFSTSVFDDGGKPRCLISSEKFREWFPTFRSVDEDE